MLAFHVKLPLEIPHPESILPCSEIAALQTDTQTDGISCAARIFSGQILRSAALRAALRKSSFDPKKLCLFACLFVCQHVRISHWTCEDSG